jgi:hypothetical protein
MSKKDDKHLELIKKRGYFDRSPESLKKYQTKITKLANALRKDILDDNVRELFSKTDLQAIEQAVVALTGFKDTVAHAREHSERERKRKDAVYEATTKDALRALDTQYPNASSTPITKLRFVFSVEYITGADQFAYFCNDIKLRLSNNTPSSISAFPEWIDNKFNSVRVEYARLLIAPFGEQVDPKRVTYYFEKLDAALSDIDEKAGRLLNDSAWYLAKAAGGLSGEDREKLGI